MTIIQHKRGTSSNWTSSNPILAVGEIGYETDTGKFKIGNGTSTWSALSYFEIASGAGSGTVTSVTLTLPTGLTVSGSPITTSGTLAVSFDTGYSIPTTAKQTEWDTAYGWGNHASAGYQAGDADLTAIAALSANGLLRKTAGTWGMDTATYLTSYTETDTLSDVTGRGATTNSAISITNATSSTTTTTGALKVTGGVGIVENLNVGGNVVVTGDLTVKDLTVNGTTTTINSTIITVDDPIFTLGGDTAPGSDDNKDRGIAFRWHNGATAKIGFFGFDDSAQQFTFIPDATITNEVVSGSAGTIVANLSGSATSADTLSTSRNLWGQSFNGSGDITGSLTSVSDITSSDTTFSIGTTSVTTVSGNAIGITAGTTNNTIGTGGSVSVTGGSATASTGAVFGGNVNIAGGASTLSSSGTGGSVSILAGNGNTKGTISIGTSNTSGITIGASGITTTIVGTLSATLNALTISSPLSGTSYNGSSAVSIGLSTGYGDTQNPYGTKSQYHVLAGPVTPTPGAPTFRLLDPNDIPDLSGTYLTTGGTAASTTNITISTINGNTSDTTLYPVFVGGNTAISQAPHTDVAGIVYNASTDSLSLTGNLTVTGGDVLLGGTGTATTIKTLATTGTSSGGLTIATGDTTTSGTSGNISIDVGNGASSEGTISIGTTNASAITIGKAGTTTTIAGTLNATVSTATSADTAKTISTATDASFYPVFVDANNGTATSETLYTDAGLVYNPSTNKLSTGGDLSVNGGDLETTSTGTASLFNTNATTLNIGGGATTAVNIGNASGLANFAGAVDLRAGGTAANTAPLYFSSSTSVLDTPVAGAVEYNNANFFATPFTTSGRGLIESNYFYSNQSTISIAGTSTGGAAISGSAFAVALPLATSTAYQIEATLYLQTSYSTNAPASQTMTFSYPTGTTILAEGIIVQNVAAATTQSTAGSFYAMQANTNRTMTAVTTSGNWHRISMRGIIRTSTNAGSFSINFGGTNGATPATLQLTLGANSFIKLTPVGSATSDNSIGAWA